MSGSPIEEFYNGQKILVTGASGLMGKVLIEKLLYSCPDVTAIYMLIRPKRGRTPEQRVQDMWQLPMFQRLRSKYPRAVNKMVPIAGDVSSPALGLDAKTTALLRSEVTVVFHCAATLRLEAQLKDAVEMNTWGTERLLELCRGMKNLKSLIHLSTAFCCCDIETLMEKVYEPAHVPKDIMGLAQWMDHETMDRITPNLLHPHPNTYTYSKRLAEALIRDEFPNLPVAIARPSIVTPSWEEPVQGWVDNLNGPVGLMVGGGKGVIRSMLCNGDLHAEVIPLDRAINGLIIIGWKTATTKDKPSEIPVYNMTSTDDKRRQTWREILDKGKETAYKYPFEGAIWYPDGNIRANRFIHWLCVVFFHLLPAYFIDFLLMIFMQKRFMVRIQKRISDGLDVLQFFTTREWNFSYKKFKGLEDVMTAADRKTFSISPDDIDIEEYLKRCILGAKQYCMKEKLENLPKARLQLKCLYVLHVVTKYALYSWLLWNALKLTGLVNAVSNLQQTQEI